MFSFPNPDKDVYITSSQRAQLESIDLEELNGNDYIANGFTSNTFNSSELRFSVLLQLLLLIRIPMNNRALTALCLLHWSDSLL